MAKSKFPLLSPASVGPSAGPFGPMGGIRKPRKAFKRGGKFAAGGENDPLVSAVPPVPKAPPSPFTYYSPEAKAARHEGLLQSVIRRNDAEERLKKAYRGLQDSQGATGVPNYKRGGTFKKGSDLPHFFLGDLFGGTPAKTQTSTGQSGTSSGRTFNDINEPQYEKLRGETLGAATSLDFSDPNKWVAGFNPDQQKAFETIRNAQGVYAGNYSQAQNSFDTAGNTLGAAAGTAGRIEGNALPYVQQAAGMQTGSDAFNPFAAQASQGANTTVGNYMSPYQQNAMDAVGAASNKAFGAPGGPMERINDTFTGGAAAQFGRERHGDVMGNAVYNQQQALDQQLAQMANTGWQSGLTAATADQNRQAQLGQTAGQLANQDITTRAGLGATTANIGTQATQAGVQAGQGQIAQGTATQGLGTARQAAGYTDANALLSAGNQQQQLEQQRINVPLQGLQYQQSLAQGWQLPTTSNFTNQTNTNTMGSSSQSAPQGSPFGQVVGAGAALAGAMGTGSDDNTVQNQQPAGQTPYNVKVNPDGTTTTAAAAQGGQINSPFYFSAGGYVPTVTGVRKRNAMRRPPASPMGPMGGMGGMQPTGMPGMPPQAPPTAGALNPVPQPPQPIPHPANRRYARGGPFGGDAAQDRAMVERGVHQHERQMHKATSGELTKLRLARGGGVPGYADGGGFGGLLSMLGGEGGGGMGGLIPTIIGGFSGDKDAQAMMGPVGRLIGGGDPLADSPLAWWLGHKDPAAEGSVAGSMFAEGGKISPPSWPTALDEGAPKGPFGDTIKTGTIAPSTANFGSFGPPPPVAAALGGGGGGGGGKGDDTFGQILDIGMKVLPFFLARGGGVPGYAQGGYDDADIRGGYSPFLDSSTGLQGRMDERAEWLRNRPQPPEYVPPEVQARLDAEAEHERNKSGLRRWVEQVYGDVARPIRETESHLDRGNYLEALMPALAAMGSMNPTGGGAVHAVSGAVKDLGGTYLAREAARRAALANAMRRYQ